MIPTLIGVSLLVTALLRLLPSDAVDILVSSGEVQGGQATFKEIVDTRLAESGIDPATAPISDRARMENTVIGEQLKREGLDFETATDPQKNKARERLLAEQIQR